MINVEADGDVDNRRAQSHDSPSFVLGFVWSVSNALELRLISHVDISIVALLGFLYEVFKIHVIVWGSIHDEWIN